MWEKSCISLLLLGSKLFFFTGVRTGKGGGGPPPRKIWATKEIGAKPVFTEVYTFPFDSWSLVSIRTTWVSPWQKVTRRPMFSFLYYLSQQWSCSSGFHMLHAAPSLPVSRNSMFFASVPQDLFCCQHCVKNSSIAWPSGQLQGSGELLNHFHLGLNRNVSVHVKCHIHSNATLSLEHSKQNLVCDFTKCDILLLAVSICLILCHWECHCRKLRKLRLSAIMIIRANTLRSARRTVSVSLSFTTVLEFEKELRVCKDQDSLVMLFLTVLIVSSTLSCLACIKFSLDFEPLTNFSFSTKDALFIVQPGAGSSWLSLNKLMFW